MTQREGAWPNSGPAPSSTGRRFSSPGWWLRHLLDLVLYGAFGLALAALLLLGVVPHTGWYRTETVLSGSMKPYFAQGDLIVVTPEPARDVRVGQVISYHIPIDDHHVQTHRVVKVVRGGAHPSIQTKGDANAARDPWTARLDGTTAWRVRLVVPHAGWMIRWFRAPFAKFGTVLLAPLLLVLIALRRIWRAPDETASDGQAPVIGNH